MAKYITLEGLGHFLNTIKSDKFLALDTHYGCIKTGYGENNNNYAIKVDTSAWATVEWTNNKVTAVGNHYQQSTKPTQTKYGIYNIKIDAAGHITKSSTPQKNNFAGVWTELDEPIYKELDYATLKAARDSGNLAPGRLYRITDYKATSLENNDHYYEGRNPGKFDIIVEAISNSTISETAWVCHHEGDTYFSECELDKWEIKYCIDNDDERFVWPKTNGYGVIYYMKDEWGNEAPYDFKNLSPSFVYDSSMYLFNNSKNRDASVKGYKFDETGETELPRKNNIFPTNNIIKPNYNLNVPNVMDTSKIRFEAPAVNENFTGVSNNYIDYNCSNIVLSTRSHNDYVSFYDGSYGCHNNIIGRDCYNITIRNSDNNEIADHCYDIKLSNCDNTKIGRNCSNIVFVDDLQYYDSDVIYNSTNFPLPLQKSKNNIIGNNLRNITIGISCNNNIFENGGDISEFIGPNKSVLGHCCNNNIIKTNSNMNLTYHDERAASSHKFYPLPGVENCIFNKCINSTITFLELASRGGQYDNNIINPYGIGSFYFNNGTPLHKQYQFNNFEFVNISAKEYGNYLERLVYDPANNNISELPNYINKLKGMFNRGYRTLTTIKTAYADPNRNLNIVSKYG